MPRIIAGIPTAQVMIPMLRSVVNGEKVLLQVVGSILQPIGSATGSYIGPNGYTANMSEAQDFAPTVSETEIIIESPGAPGQSAYEMWLSIGNNGTHDDFIESLKGQSATQAQIDASTSAYFTIHADSFKGSPGDNATDAQVQSAVTAYFTSNPVTNGQDGKSVEIRVQGGFIQWRQVPNGTWANLVDIATLHGTNGLSVELQKTATSIQWRQAGGTWADLVFLSDLKGNTGASGATLIGQVSVGQAAAIAITLGIREVTASLAGTVVGERYIAFCRSYRLNGGTLTNGRPAGYTVLDCACNTAGQITVSINAPALAIGASYSMNVDIVKINA